MRLLRVSTLRVGDREEQRVSLGHDSLAKFADQWEEELSRGARLSKLAAALTVAATVAIVMAILAGWAFVSKRTADAARREALARLSETKDAVDKWLVGVSGDLEFYPGLLQTQKRLFEDAIKQYDKRLDKAEESLAERAELAKWHLRRGDVHNQLYRCYEQEGDSARPIQHVRFAEHGQRDGVFQRTDGDRQAVKWK